MENNNPTKLLVDASMILAISTTVLYLGDFSYEAGVEGYYKLPSYLIEVNIYSILKFAFLTAPIFLILASFLVTNLILIKNRFAEDHIMGSIFVVIIVTVLVIAVSCLVSYFFVINIEIPLCCGNVITTLTIRYVLRKRKVIKREQNVVKFSDTYTYELKFALKFLTCAFSLLIYMIFCNFLGVINAKDTDAYFVTGRQNNIIILAKSNDVLIGKIFDLKKSELSDTLIFFKLGEKDSPTLIKRNIKLKQRP